MNASLKVNKVDSANATAQATIPVDKLNKALDKVTKAASKNLKIDGFRKGHVPAAIIKKQYGAQLEQDAQRECVQDLLKDILKELEIEAFNLLGDPRITKFEKKVKIKKKV